MLASLPNVRHIRVLWPLLSQGKWAYTDSGVLDSTHLRFFTRDSAVTLLESAGLVVTTVKGLGSEYTPQKRFLSLVTLGVIRPFLDVQYALLASKPA